MAKPKDVPITFRVPTKLADRFRRAAELEAVSLSEWLRRLGLLRLAELGDRIESTRPES